jgi:hypothetical protein
MWSIGGSAPRNTCLADILSTKPVTWNGPGLNSLPLLYALFFAVMVIVNESCTRGTKMSRSGLLSLQTVILF